jgi:hypothetical protein
MADNNDFLKMVNHPLKFRLYLLYKLPAAYFSGVRIREITEEKCITSVPYKWLTQNPFRSTYFASLAMAAEMSTGLPAMSNVFGRNPPVSLLVTKMEANYLKKARGTIFFTCLQAKEISAAIEEAVATGEGKSVISKSTGKNSNGEVVAEFFFTWSFKTKSGFNKV